MAIQQLEIASFNIRALGHGFTGVQKRCEIKDYLARANPQPMVVLLQEHHFGETDCMHLTSQLDFRNGLSLWNAAIQQKAEDL